MLIRFHTRPFSVVPTEIIRFIICDISFIPQDQKLGDFCEQWMEEQALNEIRHSSVQEFKCSLGFGGLGAVLKNRTPALSDVS